jgi:hypothetical protein
MKSINTFPGLLSWLFTATFFLSSTTIASAADVKALQLSYHQQGKAIVDAIIAQKIELPEIQKNVDAMLVDATGIAKLYGEKHPAGAKLLSTVVANIPAMKKLNFHDLEKQWHDLGYFKEPGNNPGLDLASEDNEHFTDPIHVVVHPLLVLKAAEAFAADAKPEHLNVMKEEMRKIVQIVAGGEDDLSALCNDGTVWYLTHKGWVRSIHNIPQPWEEQNEA